MANVIKLKRGTSTPTTSNIADGEVAVDTSAKKLYINDNGTVKEIGDSKADLSGATFTGHVILNDSKRLKLGTDEDCSFYHNDNHAWLVNDKGNLNIRSTEADTDVTIRGAGDVILQVSEGEKGLKVLADGAVELYHNDVGPKLETTSTGISVDGNITASTFVKSGGTSSQYLMADGSVSAGGGGGGSGDKISEGNTEVETVDTGSDGHIKFTTEGVEKARITSDGVVQIANTTVSSLGDRLLQIGKTDRSATYIEVRTSTTGVGGVLFSDGTAADNTGYRGTIEYDHGATNADSMYFKTAATERLRITSTGAWAIEGASNYGTSGQVLTSNGDDAPTWQNASGGGGGGSTDLLEIMLFT